MQVSGLLQGLKHSYSHPLQYFIQLGKEEYQLNNYLGKRVQISFQGEMECIHCGRKIKKTFSNGACYPCFKNLAEHDLCIVKPHECHFDKGTCRDESFGESHCMIPHYVYLAVSSGIKVGLTRKNNQLKRWGDQGAIKAVPIAELPTRKMAGDLEVAISEHISDKTNWRKMLQGDITPIDLEQVRQEILDLVPEAFKPFVLKDEELVEFVYPILEQIEKIKSYNLDKAPVFTDRLIGIKGQYMIFDGGVINLRKYAGYDISMTIQSEKIGSGERI